MTMKQIQMKRNKMLLQREDGGSISVLFHNQRKRIAVTIIVCVVHSESVMQDTFFKSVCVEIEFGIYVFHLFQPNTELVETFNVCSAFEKV